MAEANAVFQDTLKRSKRVLGAEHLITLECVMFIMSGLATGQSGGGKYAEAEAMYKEYYPVMKRVLGSEHPLTLRTTMTYGAALANAERIDEAETMLTDLHVVMKRVLGETHYTTLATAGYLGQINSLRSAEKSKKK